MLHHGAAANVKLLVLDGVVAPSRIVAVALVHLSLQRFGRDAVHS